MEQPLSKRSLQNVVRHYDLGDLRSAHRLEKGFVNENWVLHTTRGRYFLKRRHPDLRNAGVVAAQHALIQHLRDSNFPIPAILRHVRGNTFLVLDGEFFEMHEYIEGEPYNHLNREHFRAAAVFLRRYHIHVRDFQQKQLFRSQDLYSPSILKARLSKIRQAWELDHDHAFTRKWLRLTDQTAALDEHFGRHEELPHLVIHGDYHGGNLLFRGDQIIGVVDYDKVRWQPRVVELAEALIYFTSARPGRFKHLIYPGFLLWDKFSSFLRYYLGGARGNEKGSDRQSTLSPTASSNDARESLEIAFLTDGEVYALSDFICCIWLSVSLERLLEKGVRPAAALEALQELLELAEWGARNRELMQLLSVLARVSATKDWCND